MGVSSRHSVLPVIDAWGFVSVYEALVLLSSDDILGETLDQDRSKLKLWFQKQGICLESITMLLLLSFWYKASVSLQIYTTVHFDSFKGQNVFIVSATAKWFALFCIITLSPSLCFGFFINPFADFGFWKETLRKDWFSEYSWNESKVDTFFSRRQKGNVS